MATYLAKNTTVAEVIDAARLRSGTLVDALISPAICLKLLDLGVRRIASALNAAASPAYMTSLTDASTAYTSNVASIAMTTYAVERIVKVVDSSHGNIKFASFEEFEQLSSISNIYINDIFWSFEGETVRLRKVGTVTTGNTVVHYYKQPTEATISDTPDIPDKYVPLLVNIVTTDLIRHKTCQGDQTIETRIDRELQEMQAGFVASLQTEGPKVKRNE